MSKLLTTTALVLLLSVSAFTDARAEYRLTVLADNPIVYYDFDDGTSANGDTAHNSGTFGSAHDGTYTNDVALVSGAASIPGTAAGFDGGNDHVSSTTLNNFGSNMGAGFSVEFWINTTESSLRTVTGMLNQNSGMGWKVELNRRSDLAEETGVTNFWLRASNYKNLGAHITTDIYDGQWHHVVWVVNDPTANDVAVYVDSLPQTLTMVAESPSSFMNFEFPIAIGAANSRDTVTSLMNGLLDEFAIFDTPLSQERVEAHFAAAVPEPSTFVLALIGLLGWLGCVRRRGYLAERLPAATTGDRHGKKSKPDRSKSPSVSKK